MRRSQWFWLAAGWIGFALLPWYDTPLSDDRTWSLPALFAGLFGSAPWLLPLLVPLLMPVVYLTKDVQARATALTAAGIIGIAYMILQGFGFGLHGWSWAFLESVFGQTERFQNGFGYGANVTLFSFLFMLTEGLAARGWMKGDRFVTGSIGLVIGTILFFVFLPVSTILSNAAIPDGEQSAMVSFFYRMTDADIWSLSCVMEDRRCGVFWNSLRLGILTGAITTLLGLAFALVATRTNFPFKRGLRLLTVLPIITPPFVISLAIILLFGRNGTVTIFLADVFDIGRSRWIYGLPGILITQALAFTPIAFLVLIGVVQGIAPSMEEASHTLRANRWQTFRHVTWPLLRPGLANAFLIGFIESLADFGNPLVLGGNYDVLSTKIFFAVVGSQNDPGRAGALAIVLLMLCVGAFYIQRRWLGKKSYQTLTGKGDSGRPSELPRGLKYVCYATALPWAVFTLILYTMIMFGGFVKVWGRDNSFSLDHFAANFGLEWTEFGLLWSGRAWDSLFTTLQIAAISAPLTAGMGLLTAYLLVRQRFAGQASFEFITMLSFAIPGTVIGVSYVLAFNTPPLEITGTGIILVLCFIYRNMPVSIRAGVAAMSQIDKSLDECAMTLGATSAQTVRRVVLPLLRPAIVAALVYSFVRAITSVSAVIFLVSARYDLATSYIVGRVENGEYGLAIAYSATLIVIMAAAITLIQFAVGERKVSRRTSSDAVKQEVPA